MILPLLRFLSPLVHPLSFSRFHVSSSGIKKWVREDIEKEYRSSSFRREDNMSHENSRSKLKKTANFRLCKVNSHTTELIEIQSDDPTLHVLFIPGNPGVVPFYKDFVESLYELLGGTASVTGDSRLFVRSVSAIGHICFTKKNLERGKKLFSLQQQIDHKVDFIVQENIQVPIVLIGHSIGSYMSLEVLRRVHEKVVLFVGLYPFLKFNPLSEKQVSYVKITENSFLSAFLSFTIATVGLLPKCMRRFIVSKSIGKSWSPTAIDAACTHLVKYHTFRNMLFLAKSEFRKLSEETDWEFMKENERKITFLFGIDDHWGPLQVYEEISTKVPDVALSIEREGHTHSFCVTETGSDWVARFAASLIKNRVSKAV